VKSGAAEIATLLRQIEDLLRFPGAIGHGATVPQLALSIARQAPTQEIELLALQLAAEPQESEVQVGKLLWKLREALKGTADS
jgi:hypothetical protein